MAISDYCKFAAVGRLAQDPELRYLPSGMAVTHFSLAVNTYNSKGENAVSFFPVIVFNKFAETIAERLKKGSKVLVEGRPQIRVYTKEGQKARAYEVIATTVQFLDPRTSGEDAVSQTTPYAPAMTPGAAPAAPAPTAPAQPQYQQQQQYQSQPNAPVPPQQPQQMQQTQRPQGQDVDPFEMFLNQNPFGDEALPF